MNGRSKWTDKCTYYCFACSGIFACIACMSKLHASHIYLEKIYWSTSHAVCMHAQMSFLSRFTMNIENIPFVLSAWRISPVSRNMHGHLSASTYRSLHEHIVQVGPIPTIELLAPTGTHASPRSGVLAYISILCGSHCFIALLRCLQVALRSSYNSSLQFPVLLLLPFITLQPPPQLLQHSPCTGNGVKRAGCTRSATK